MAPQTTADPYESIATPTPAAPADPYASIAAPPPTPPQSLGQKVGEGLGQTMIGQVAQAAIKGPETPTEQVIHALAGVPGLSAFRAAKAVVGSVDGIVKASANEYPQAVQDFQRTVQDFHKGDWRNAASSAVSTATDAAGIVSPQLAGIAGQARELSEGARPGGNLATPLTRDIVDAGTVLATGAVGDALSPEATAARAAEARTSPSVTSQVLKGTDAAQPQVQAALRNNPWAAARNAASSFRTLLKDPISALKQTKSSLYGTVDAAAGTDFKGLYDKLDNVEDKIHESTNPAEEAKHELDRQNIMDTIADAKDRAQKVSVNVDQTLQKADKVYTQQKALEDLDRAVFSNNGVVEGNVEYGAPENVNVDNAIKALEKLKANVKFGDSRLTQALGSQQAADSMLKGMYDAKASGVKYMNRKIFANTLAKYVAPTAVGLAAGAALGAAAMKP